MDFKNICRVCLEERKGLNSLFGASVAKMLMTCASIIVIEGDGLPDQICKQCTIRASQAFRFKELCEKSDSTLREYLSSTKLTTEISEIKSDLLLADNNSLVGGHCSVFSDIFMKNDALIEPLFIEPSTLSAALECNMQSITDQCLPSLWNMKPDLNQQFCDNTLQNINEEKHPRDDWNIDLDIDNQDIDSSTYTKSYIDLDHSSRIINEDRFNKKQNDTFNCLNINEEKHPRDDWNIDLDIDNQDIDSSTYTKSYIDLDHSSRIINEDRFNKKQNDTFNCLICGKIFLDAKSFKKHHHVNQNPLEKRYMCNICGKRYKENKLLLIHMRVHTGERPYKCEICGKTFGLRSSFNKHRQLHSGIKKHKCLICDKAFFQVSNFNNHMRTHTGLKPFICTICGKNYTTKTDLERHSLVHSGHKPYNCVICDSSFRTHSQLKRHGVKHSGEKNYMCSHCGQSFAHKETRDTHARYHTNDRPYKCTVCPKTYIASTHLRRHMLTHTNERRHQCTICNKVFMQRRHLSNHMHTHTGQRPYSCSVCGRRFAQSGTLSTHMKVHKKSCDKFILPI